MNEQIPVEAEARALPHVRALRPYVPGEQPQGDGWTKLNTNENPYPPSSRVPEAVAAEAQRLRLYPEPLSRRLREALAAQEGLEPENLIIGNGSDNLLDLITRCFVGARGIGHTVPSYSLYPVVAAMSRKRIADFEFDRSMRLEIGAITAADTDVFFLTNPNAPTGVHFELSAIEAILRDYPGLLVVDEAYIDFGGTTAAPLLQAYDNLIVVRTFSKSHSLAGMRVGYAMAAAGVISVLDRVRDAYNVDRLAQAAALAALEDRACFVSNRDKIVETRARVMARFREWGWFAYPSAANFLFAEPRTVAGETGADAADGLFHYLREHRVLVRYFPGHPLTCAFLRISIGTDSEMEAFTEAVESWRKQNGHQ